MCIVSVDNDVDAENDYEDDLPHIEEGFCSGNHRLLARKSRSNMISDMVVPRIM